MKTNKKEWRLVDICGDLCFEFEAGSQRAAEDYVRHHLPRNAVKSELRAMLVEPMSVAIYMYPLNPDNFPKIQQQMQNKYFVDLDEFWTNQEY